MVAAALAVVTRSLITTPGHRMRLAGGLGAALPIVPAAIAAARVEQSADGGLRIVAAQAMPEGILLTIATNGQDTSFGSAAQPDSRFLAHSLSGAKASLPVVLRSPISVAAGDVARGLVHSCRAGLGILLEHWLTNRGITIALVNAARLWRLNSLLSSAQGLLLLRALNTPNDLLTGRVVAEEPLPLGVVGNSDTETDAASNTCTMIGSVAGPFSGSNAKELRLPPRLEIEALVDLHRALSVLVARVDRAMLALFTNSSVGSASVSLTGGSETVAPQHSRRGRVLPGRRKVASEQSQRLPLHGNAATGIQARCAGTMSALQHEQAVLQTAVAQAAARIASAGGLLHLASLNADASERPQAPDRMRLHLVTDGGVAVAMADALPAPGMNACATDDVAASLDVNAFGDVVSAE